MVDLRVGVKRLLSEKKGRQCLAPKMCFIMLWLVYVSQISTSVSDFNSNIHNGLITKQFLQHVTDMYG